MIRRFALAMSIAGLLVAADSAAYAAGPASSAAHVRGSAGPVVAYVTRWGSNTVTPVFTATRSAGRPIRVANAPGALAVGRDGKTIYVVSANFGARTTHGFVTPIRAATLTAGRRVTVGLLPKDIAVTPDGKTAWVVGETTVTPIATATGRAGRRITVVRGNGDHANALVITPDGKTAYVATSFTVVPVNLATRRAGRAIPLRNSVWALSAMAVTPDGKTVYALTGQNAVPISTRTNKAGRPLRVGLAATAIAITPDGRTAYVGSLAGRPAAPVTAVYPVSTRTNKSGKPIKLGRPSLSALVTSIAISPHGKTAYVATDNAVYAIDTRAGKARKLVNAMPAHFSPVVIEISPDRKTAWVMSSSNNSGAGVLTPITIATGKAGTPIHIGKDPACLLLTTSRPLAAPRQSSCTLFL